MNAFLFQISHGSSGTTISLRIDTPSQVKFFDEVNLEFFMEIVDGFQEDYFSKRTRRTIFR